MTLEEYNDLREQVLSEGAVELEYQTIPSADGTRSVEVIRRKRLVLGEAGITTTYTYEGTAENFRLVSSDEVFYRGVEVLIPPSAEEVN